MKALTFIISLFVGLLAFSPSLFAVDDVRQQKEAFATTLEKAQVNKFSEIKEKVFIVNKVIKSAELSRIYSKGIVPAIAQDFRNMMIIHDKIAASPVKTGFIYRFLPTPRESFVKDFNRFLLRSAAYLRQ